MVSVSITTYIDAPVEKVFSVVADIREFSKALPHVTSYEFISEIQKGLGTRFKETRTNNGKETTTELEVTEFEENERIRLVSDTHGTVWDSLFTVSYLEGQTILSLLMEAKAHKILPKIVNPLVKGLFRKAIQADMDLVKVYCEEKA